MRISDWSSDVCSSDLPVRGRLPAAGEAASMPPHRSPIHGGHPMSDLAPVLDHLRRGFDGAVGRLCDLLRIRSVSTDPVYKDEVVRAAQWMVDDLRSMGFAARLRQTPGHPVVVAHHPGPGGDRPEEHTSELPSQMRNSYA